MPKPTAPPKTVCPVCKKLSQTNASPGWIHYECAPTMLDLI